MLDALPSSREVDAVVAALEKISDDPVASSSGIIATKMLKRALVEAQGEMVRAGDDSMLELISTTLVDAVSRQGDVAMKPATLSAIARSLLVALRPHMANASEPLPRDTSRFRRLSPDAPASIKDDPTSGFEIPTNLSMMPGAGGKRPAGDTGNSED